MLSALFAAGALALAQAGQPAPPVPPGVAGVTALPTKPAAPPFKPGMKVVDPSGALIGAIQTMTETSGGANVVLSIDGKLVGVAPSTLQLQGPVVVSSQTKRQILASAHAQP